MKIHSDNYTHHIDTEKEIVHTTKSFSELAAGDKFKATVIDIKPNMVTIQLSNGESLTARSLILPDARINDETIFMVKENIKGQILLEMIKPNSDVLRENIAKEAIISAKLFPTQENINIVKALIENKLPIDANSLQKAMYFNYSKENISLDKLLFLMKEGFAPQEKNMNILNGIMDKTLTLNNDLSLIIKNIFLLEDKQLSQSIIKEFIDFFNKNKIDNKSSKIKDDIDESFKLNNKETDHDVIKSILTKIQEKLFINIKEYRSLNSINNYFRSIHEIFSNILRLTENNPAAEKVHLSTQNILMKHYSY